MGTLIYESPKDPTLLMLDPDLDMDPAPQKAIHIPMQHGSGSNPAHLHTSSHDTLPELKLDCLMVKYIILNLRIINHFLIFNG